MWFAKLERLTATTCLFKYVMKLDSILSNFDRVITSIEKKTASKPSNSCSRQRYDHLLQLLLNYFDQSVLNQ